MTRPAIDQPLIITHREDDPDVYHDATNGKDYQADEINAYVNAVHELYSGFMLVSFGLDGTLTIRDRQHAYKLHPASGHVLLDERRLFSGIGQIKAGHTTINLGNEIKRREEHGKKYK